MPTSILIVDPQPADHLLLRMVLERAGYQVVMARTAREVVSALQQVKPALAMIEQHLPGMDGGELCARLKARPATRHLPLILTSADPDGHLVARSLPVIAYLRKPVSPKDMLAVIRRVMAPARA
jgi:putative two-component system response regulator